MKKLIKKIRLVVVASIVGITSLVGCSEKKDLPTVGIIQLVEHLSLDTIRESIISDLESKGYIDGETVNIDYKNAQGDQNNIMTICQKFVGDDVDVIVTIATPTAQAAAGVTKDIPIVFSAVTDPVSAKIVKNPSNPESNITGTSDAIPVDKVFELCKKLTPDVKKIGFLYTASEVNSQVIVDRAIELAPKYGFEYEVMTITNTSELKQAAELLAAKVDAIYTPIDNTIASAMSLLSKVGRDMKLPIYVGADSMVVDGGYATIGINYEALGKKTADIIDEVLKGTSISNLPVVTLDEFDTIVNQTTAEIIGATVPTEDVIIVH
ncbi:MAG: ABC transporter substrate binding protein [Cellulosilyticaceae bacterium]